MLKFPALIVHRGNVFYLLYFAGGLLMTASAAAGAQCLDVAVRTVQNPETLLFLSNTLMGLMGMRRAVRKPLTSCSAQADIVIKPNLRKVFFTASLSSLLHLTRTSLRDTFVFLCWFSEKQRDLQATNSVSTKRCRIYYIILSGGSSPLIWMLCIRGSGGRTTTRRSSNGLQWLIDFSRKMQAQGHVMFLLLDGQAGPVRTGSHSNDPSGFTLWFSVLVVILLWVFLSHIGVCGLICLAWKFH